ncbi:MAG: group 1 truncated hemoglobin [Sphingomonadales bacterium]|nr:group 1 truncated hemoglobin [Sphingomonadales bacterium]
MADTLFDELGGRPCLERVHRIFYDKLLAHPWLKGFFINNTQWHLEVQQTEFMQRLFGGPNIYKGRMPKYAHQHMFITEEIYMLRHKILEQSLVEAGVEEELRERWLRYDIGLKLALVKSDQSECIGRYNDEPVVVIEKPEGYQE